ALPNLEGTAPGVSWVVDGTQFFFLAGVPSEYKFVLNKTLVPYFKKRASSQGNFLFILKVFGRRESELNDFMHSIKIPSQVTIGFRTHLPENHVKLNVKARSATAAEKLITP